MKKTKTLIVAAVAFAAMTLGGAVASATSTSTANTSASTTAEPKTYGLCASVKTGAVRTLEVGNLAKSAYGSCRQDGSERYLGVLGAGYVPPVTPLPAQLAFSAGRTHYVCSTATAVKLWPVRSETPKRYGKAVSPARYSCVKADRVRTP